MQKTNRKTKAVLLGILSGLAVSVAFIFPMFVGEIQASARESVREKNLVVSRGEAFGDIEKTNVKIKALLNGKPQDGMSVSPNMNIWYTPINGESTVSLETGTYKFAASHENRVVTSVREIQASDHKDAATQVTLDVDNAPLADDLVFFTVDKNESKVFPLHIQGADAVIYGSAPSELKIVKSETGFDMQVDGKVLGSGFWSFAVRAENEYGFSMMQIGLRVVEEKEPILLYTVDDLNAVRKNLSGSYQLMNDLDMSEVDNWVPIGSAQYPFTGIFDGGGYEISSFHAPEKIAGKSYFALFCEAKNAEIKNLIMREPVITPTAETNAEACAIIVGIISNCFMENLATIDGLVSASSGQSHLTIGSARSSVLLNLFNSTETFGKGENRMYSSGAVVSNTYDSYTAYCANEGNIKANFMEGGVVCFNSNGIVKKIINSGAVWGSTLVGEFPPGGVVHTVDGGFVTYSYFVKGQTATGGSSFQLGVLNSVVGIGFDDLKNPKALPNLGSFEGENPQWAYASIDAKGPVPFGIFKKQADKPIIKSEEVHLPKMDDTLYFYTLDGSDPLLNGKTGVETVELKLKQNETITVFAAQKGFRNSEVVTFTNTPNQGGRQ